MLNYGAPGANDYGVSETDLDEAAYRPFMDADGDGMPDTSLLATRLFTDALNDGAPVPSKIQNDWSDDQLALFLEWQRFQKSAKYEVAVRVVPHGGMVSLGAGRPIRRRAGLPARCSCG